MNLRSVLHTIWEKIQQSAARSVKSKTVKIIGAALVAIVIIGAIIWALYPYPWSGFGSYINPKGEFQRYKTFWDWMQMLIVPLALAAFATWFTHRRESLAREIEKARTQEAREIEEARTREERLQNYFDRMTELMLDKGLRRSEPGAEVRDIARARSLTVLRSLDGERKAALLRFLFEADLITIDKSVIILDRADLSGADLLKADLSQANLRRANLEKANLCRANLTEADLRVADLSQANLTEAVLNGAVLRGADLIWTDFDGANLREANLNGADLRGADLRGADLSGADLREAIGLTQDQVDSAWGSEDTRLPQGLVRPEHWAKPPMAKTPMW